MTSRCPKLESQQLFSRDLMKLRVYECIRCAKTRLPEGFFVGSSDLADAWDGSSLRKILKSRCFCEVERRKVRDLDADRRGRLERNAVFQKSVVLSLFLSPLPSPTVHPTKRQGRLLEGFCSKIPVLPRRELDFRILGKTTSSKTD